MLVDFSSVHADFPALLLKQVDRFVVQGATAYSHEEFDLDKEPDPSRKQQVVTLAQLAPLPFALGTCGVLTVLLVLFPHTHTMHRL